MLGVAPYDSEGFGPAVAADFPGQPQFCRLDNLVFLSEFGGVSGYEHTSSEQPGVDRVCSWSQARIRGRGQENDPDLDSIHVPDLRQVEEHGQDRYSTDDRR
jgi:hypothetical protein